MWILQGAARTLGERAEVRIVEVIRVEKFGVADGAVWVHENPKIGDQIFLI